MSANPDFNAVARPYDFMSRLVFGNALIESQVSLLEHIPANSRILIAGGGTGWILEAIAKIHTSGLEITYVEVASSMITLSKRRNPGQNKVFFVHQPIESYQTDQLFDVIITPFLFDLFLKNKVQTLFYRLDNQLKTGGLWLYTDFIPEKYQTRLWQKMLLKAMYLFFGIISKVDARALTDMDPYFEKGYGTVIENWFYGKFIRSNIYQKQARHELKDKP
ncbi:class I SAM-dependent methyltransferase [Dyadobacter sp. LHD-138]|uniref:class I SAM-dependent methyltransferase n=1 Tax=Dyadobacter sp. LHD-138 TaxID=3071413 RepID=UPI0027E0BB87|nr:class I SAM-dependent methyltransferase [Dyadobacter sp. LHD-138]MDQ6477507.1 class I SAM-dependent methyltransferase [Dyadobacter sp. LHD-138]